MPGIHVKLKIVGTISFHDKSLINLCIIRRSGYAGNSYKGNYYGNNYGGYYSGSSGQFTRSSGLFGSGGKKKFALAAGAGFLGGAVAGAGAMAVYHRYQQFKAMMYYKSMYGGYGGGYSGFGGGYGNNTFEKVQMSGSFLLNKCFPS